jgi:purine nucleosidase/pyrimidine-specific ribonucleoside hydrolase
VKKIIIDTDPGLDDAVAIMFALGSRRLDLQAITTASGNLQADRCAANACKVLDLVGAGRIPVACGPQTPLVRPYPKDPFSHGDDGLANLGLPESTRQQDARFAADLIVDVVNEHAGDVSLIAIGPLTNIALAVMKDPELPGKVSELIIVGGAYGTTASPGSLHATGDNPTSEWNIYVDPEAASRVFDAGFALTAIGLEIVTHDSIELSPKQRAVLKASSSKAAWFLGGAIDFVERRDFRSYCALIDSVAVAVALDPTIIRTEKLHVGIETRGEMTTGQTVVDRRKHFLWTHLPQVNVATAIDSARFIDLLLEAVT